jgi:ribose-phosphate pyrophosphokinase
MPSRVIHAAPALARWIAAHVSAPLIVGPDSESEQWVQEVAEHAGAPFTVMSKVRRGDRDVTIEAPALSRWQGRTPVLVDDIVSTARTMTAAVAQLRRAGYPHPVCVGVHAIFSGDAYQTLQAAGPAGIVTGNSVPHPSNGIDLVPDLLTPVRELLDRETNAAG